MPNILTLECSTSTCSVALQIKEHCTSLIEHTPQTHSQKILPMIDQLLAEQALTIKQLDAIAFGRGPGSFTGLRIAASITQGLAFAADLPVIAVSSLATLAQSSVDEILKSTTQKLSGSDYILAVLDARIDEIYGAWFQCDEHGAMVACSDEFLLSPELVAFPQHLTALATPNSGARWFAVGSGCAYGAADFAKGSGKTLTLLSQCNAAFPRIEPDAKSMLILANAAWQRGEYVSAEQALPIYLRDKVTG